MKLVLPSKVIDTFKTTGIISFGERHGIKENYDILESIINSLPEIPNLAIEFGYFDKIELENYLSNSDINPKNILDKARINQEYFEFLKKFYEKYPDKKILYFAENVSHRITKPFDEQYADYFFDNFNKPIMIIAGETHARKSVINWNSSYIQYPMCYFIKNKFGDFPMLKFFPASGSCYYKDCVQTIPTQDVKTDEFSEFEENSFLYYYPKATPTTPFL